MASWAERVRRLGVVAVRTAVQGARLAVGIPDYATYLAHMRSAHPAVTPMNRDAFFRDRMDARYARGRSRCC
jgi:uncharacterized short protein YbdD (DUF466 family)